MTQQQTDFELMQWRPAFNSGGTTIGARELCKVVGGSGLERSIVSVAKPDTSAGIYCVNGPTPIPAGKYGKVCFGPILLVQADSVYSTEDLVGWSSGSGVVSSGGTPILVVLRMVGVNNLALCAPITTDTIVTHWGKLDSDLYYDDTTGVTASIWAQNGSGVWADTTLDLTYVMPPPTMESGVLLADTFVRLDWIDGHWYATVPGSNEAIEYWGKLDSDLAFDDTTGVTFSIWAYDTDTDAWADVDADIDYVLPPPEMKSGIIPQGLSPGCDMLLKIQLIDGLWFVTDYPKMFLGELEEDLVDDGTADVTVGSSTFPDVKGPQNHLGTTADGSNVIISLLGDGFWRITYIANEIAYWGKLDNDLDYDNSVGVTVSIWNEFLDEDTTKDIANVFPPPTMTEGTIDSGSWVKIEKIKGRWYVTLAPC